MIWSRAESAQSRFSLSGFTHPPNRFQSVCPPPRCSLPLLTQGCCMHMKVKEDGQGSEAILLEVKRNTKSTCRSPLHQRESLFALNLQERHLVRKVVTREMCWSSSFPLILPRYFFAFSASIPARNNTHAVAKQDSSDRQAS